MSSKHLYQFEDSPLKRDACREIVRLLNASGQERNIEVALPLEYEYNSGLEKSPVRLADSVVRALNDPNGLILLDLRLQPPNYADAGLLLVDRFKEVVTE